MSTDTLKADVVAAAQVVAAAVATLDVSAVAPGILDRAAAAVQPAEESLEPPVERGSVARAVRREGARGLEGT